MPREIREELLEKFLENSWKSVECNSEWTGEIIEGTPEKISKRTLGKNPGEISNGTSEGILWIFLDEFIIELQEKFIKEFLRNSTKLLEEFPKVLLKEFSIKLLQEFRKSTFGWFFEGIAEEIHGGFLVGTPQVIVEEIPGKIPDGTSEAISQWTPGEIPNGILGGIPNRIPGKFQKKLEEFAPEEILYRIPWVISKKASVGNLKKKNFGRIANGTLGRIYDETTQAPEKFSMECLVKFPKKHLEEF